MERVLAGPAWDADYGTAEQCAKYVGIDKALWMQLDRADLIMPPAARRSREVVYWHWHSAVMVSLTLIHLLARLRALPPESGRKKSRKKPEDTGPHSPRNG